MTVPSGCRSQGCHGYLLDSPRFYQAPSSHSSIVDGFKKAKIRVKKYSLGHFVGLNAPQFKRGLG